MGKMEIKYVSPNDLKPYEENPRINEHAVDSILKSIDTFDWTQPIVVDKETNKIAIGHVRWKAATRANLEEVPVYFREFKSQAEFDALVLADNKLSEKSKWDVDKVSELLNKIENEDDDLLESLGYSEDELDALLDTTDIDDMLEEQEMPSSSPTAPKSHVKMVQIFLDDVTFPKFIEMAEAIQSYMTTDNLTDTVFNAVEKVYDEVKNLK